MKSILPLALAAMLLGGPAARAEEFLDQLDLVRELYEEGDIGGAMSELEFARQMLEERLGERFVAVFPEPPEGWRAGEVQRQSGAMFGGGTFLERSYSDAGGDARIDTQIIAGSPMIQAFAAMMANPAMMASEPGAERVRIGRTNAVLIWDETTRSGELRFLVGGAMVQLVGSDLADADVLLALAKGFDLPAIEELTGG